MLLHLFKKTYIDLDLHIESQFDRVVISEELGNKQLDILEKITPGTLFSFGHTWADVIGPDKQYPTLFDFIKFCSDHNDKTNRKLTIYCDKAAG